MANIQEHTTTDMPEKDKEIYLKLTKWLYDTENHASETLYRSESKGDYEFYAGDQDTADVLDAASKDARELKLLESERRVGMLSYVAVIYVAVFVFLVIIISKVK